MSSVSQTSLRQVRCRECRAENNMHDLRCWICGNALPGADQQELESLTSVPLRQVAAAGSIASFRLSSLMLTMILLGICFAIARHSVAASLALLLITWPAFLRTMFVVQILQDMSPHVSVVHKVEVFLRSILIVITIVSAFVIAFGAVVVVAIAAFVTVDQWAGYGGGLTLLGIIIGVSGGSAVALFASLVIARLVDQVDRRFPVVQPF